MFTVAQPCPTCGHCPTCGGYKPITYPYSSPWSITYTTDKIKLNDEAVEPEKTPEK